MTRCPVWCSYPTCQLKPAMLICPKITTIVDIHEIYYVCIETRRGAKSNQSGKEKATAVTTDGNCLHPLGQQFSVFLS